MQTRVLDVNGMSIYVLDHRRTDVLALVLPLMIIFTAMSTSPHKTKTHMIMLKGMPEAATISSIVLLMS